MTADVLVPVGMALSRELRSESRAAAEFIPGDQFLPRLSFSAVEYQRGSIGPQIARELRLDLSERPWYVVAAISSSGGRDVRSTPWVVVHR